jgi:hypothetical protein
MENYQQYGGALMGVCCEKYLGRTIFLHLPAYPHPPHYYLVWGWNNFQHTRTYTIHNFYDPNNEPRKWHSSSTILQGSYTITFP